MADVQPAENTETTGLTLEAAASLFESMDSDDSEDTSADESQQDSVEDEQPEQLVDDEVVEDETETESSEDDDEVEDSDEVAEPAKLKVKLADGEVELTADEVAKGYLRNADYTRKTQALAAETKTRQAEFDAVVAERKQYATQLTQLADALKSYAPQEPDWATLQAEQPEEFPAAYASWQLHLKQMEKVETARKAAVDAVTKDQIKHLEAHLESERAKLIEAIPSWKNEAVAKREREALFQYAKDKGGYTEDELDGVYDHRVMTLLRKAFLYDKSRSAKPAVQAKIAAVKAATPGPAATSRKPKVTERTVAKTRLAKSGSIRDAAALFEQMDD